MNINTVFINSKMNEVDTGLDVILGDIVNRLTLASTEEKTFLLDLLAKVNHVAETNDMGQNKLLENIQNYNNVNERGKRRNEQIRDVIRSYRLETDNSRAFR